MVDAAPGARERAIKGLQATLDATLRALYDAQDVAAASDAAARTLSTESALIIDAFVSYVEACEVGIAVSAPDPQAEPIAYIQYWRARTVEIVNAHAAQLALDGRVPFDNAMVDYEPPPAAGAAARDRPPPRYDAGAMARARADQLLAAAKSSIRGQSPIIQPRYAGPAYIGIATPPPKPSTLPTPAPATRHRREQSATSYGSIGSSYSCR